MSNRENLLKQHDTIICAAHDALDLLWSGKVAECPFEDQIDVDLWRTEIENEWRKFEQEQVEQMINEVERQIYYARGYLRDRGIVETERGIFTTGSLPLTEIEQDYVDFLKREGGQ